MISGDGRSILGRNGNFYLRDIFLILNARLYSTKAGNINKSKRGSVQNNTVKFRDIHIKSISNLKNLIAAYELIKSKSRNLTKGTDDKMLDGVSLRLFLKIQEELKSGKFKFSPGRKVEISKLGKKKKGLTSLVVGSLREKIVQKGIEIVMNSYYDKTFNINSFGFRPKLGVQDAILRLDQQFRKAKWVIEGDLSNAFDSISHKKFMEILKKDIKCDKTLKLIKSFLQAGYVNNLGTLTYNYLEGVLQGSILSPLLCNIYLNELDKFIEIIKLKYEINLNLKEYTMWAIKVNCGRCKGWNKSDRIRNKEFKNLPNSYSRKEVTIKIDYIRYADNFIIGIAGPISLAKKIYNELDKFLKSIGLKLNKEKTSLTDIKKNNINFLGFKIKNSILLRKRYGLTIQGNKKYKIRLTSRLTFHIDYEKIIKRLKNKNLIRLRISPGEYKKQKYVGRSRGNLVNWEHANILRYYNGIMRGLYNYYYIVNNTSYLVNILWILKQSCGLTLARKFKLKTLRKIMFKFGKNFRYTSEKKGEKQYVDLFWPDNFKIGNPKVWKNTVTLKDNDLLSV